MSETRWLPLESNPDVMNKYVQALGTNPDWEFTDVFGLDPDLLMMVPRPCSSLLLLYPITDKSEATKIGAEDSSANLYFIKQTIGNACGTIGLIHAICNNTDKITLKGDSCLDKFLKKTKDMGPAEKAAELEKDKDFGNAHSESAQEGQTKAPSIDEKIKYHFVCFIHKDGTLYELDGRKDHPIKHGNTTPDSLLEDAAAVVKKFMERDPDNLNFTVVALSAKQ